MASGYGALAIVLSSIVVAGWGYLRLRQHIALRPFLLRACQKQKWITEFGANHAAAIDRFLDVFCDAFNFPKRHKFQLSPDDGISAFYQNYYIKGEADCLEHTEYFLMVEDMFSLKLPANLTVDWTLGRLLRLILDPAQDATH